MDRKPSIHVEYIEVKDETAIIGKVVWEHDFHMHLDALAYIPPKDDEIKPPGCRTLYRVVRVRREYLKTKTKLKVIVVKAGR